MDQAPPVLYTWRCNYANHLNASGVPPCSMSQVFVIPHCSHIGGVLLVSRCDPIPLARFLSQLPDPEPAAKKARKAGKSGDHKDAAITEMPWLEHLDFQEGFEKSVSASSSGPLKVEGEEEFDETMDMEVADSCLRIMDSARSAVTDGKVTASANDFKVDPIGSQWTIDNCGTDCDAIGVKARGPVAIAFAKERIGQKSVRFDVAQHGGGQMHSLNERGARGELAAGE